jgi:hypothetical protein
LEVFTFLIIFSRTVIDKLQEGLMMELTEAEKQVTEDTRELLVTSDEKQKELTEYQTNVVNIKNMHFL